MNKYMYILFMLVTSFSCLDKDQELGHSKFIKNNLGVKM